MTRRSIWQDHGRALRNGTTSRSKKAERNVLDRLRRVALARRNRYDKNDPPTRARMGRGRASGPLVKAPGERTGHRLARLQRGERGRDSAEAEYLGISYAVRP